MRINQKILIVVLMTIFFMFILCIKAYAADEEFTLDQESIDVKLNGTGYIFYTGGTGDVTWSSSDPTIATVEDGEVKGLKIGSTTISATNEGKTVTCKVNVVYSMLKIGGNEGDNIISVNLILDEHNTESLFATAQDDNFEDISNPEVKWSSSDTSVVTVEEGTIKAIKPGKATIKAEAAGVSDTCEVTVYNSPEFTDFSNAKYEMSLNYYTETLNISEITPNEDNGYYYVVTSTKTKPNLVLKNGNLEKVDGQEYGSLIVNEKDKYMYTRNMANYTEYNQDLYLWVIQTIRLDGLYYNNADDYVTHSTKFVVEGKELSRAKLPNLNLILQTFSLGYWTSSSTNDTDNYTSMTFNFPSNTKKRNFTIKIGKVTDTSILSKIQNGDYSGITALLEYAKNNQSVYEQKLTTTDIAYYRNDETLFDGRKLLEDRAYYFIYAQFDDENGKYYPIEGVTLGQALFSSDNESWGLWAYTSDDFSWDNLKPSIDENDNLNKDDPTVAPGKLPQTGTKTITIFATISIILLMGIIFYKKYIKFKEIK